MNHSHFYFYWLCRLAPCMTFQATNHCSRVPGIADLISHLDTGSRTPTNLSPQASARSYENGAQHADDSVARNIENLERIQQRLSSIRH